MLFSDLEEVGIKYKKIVVNKNKYVLVPIGLLTGYSVGEIYYSTKEYKIPLDVKTVKNEEFLIDSISTIKDLMYSYEYEGDIDFLKEYYFGEEKDNIILIDILDNKINKKKINLNSLRKNDTKEIYENGEEAVYINSNTLDNLLNIDDIKQIKRELNKFRKSLKAFKEKNLDATRVTVENGHVKEVFVKTKTREEVEEDTKSDLVSSEDISLKGLENYIKERVFGHDEEIRHISKTLMMNYTALDNEKREPMLLVGLTGTGKTETIRAASDYLDSPFVEINTINLVPQGIKGESLEDCLYSLIVQAKDDLKKAERGFVFFDEFDKLGSNESDYKDAVKHILLKFIEGAKFTIDKQNKDYIFDTSKLNKVFAGVFEELYKRNKSLGFNSSKEEEKIDLASNISSKNYYGKELLTRIKHFYLFDELSMDTKKQILLESKLSEYLSKKERYQRQFKVNMIADDSYIDRVLEILAADNKSIRELNNLVASTLEEVEYELLSNNHQNQRLVLTKDIVDNHNNFDFIK